MGLTIPAHASPEVQQAFREIHDQLARLTTSNPTQVTDLSGRRITNAGASVAPSDLVTKADLAAAIAKHGGGAPAPTAGGVPVATAPGGGGAGPASSLSVIQLTVSALARLLGKVLLPKFTDGSAHHVILFVDQTGALAGNSDGAYAFDFNLSSGLLELGYGLIIRWLSQAGMGSPAVGVINVTDASGGSSILRLVLGLDDSSGIALTKNGSTLEIRVGGSGGATTNLKADNINADGNVSAGSSGTVNAGGQTGISASVTTSSLVGKTMTFTGGVLTGFA